MPSRAWVVTRKEPSWQGWRDVSMPSRAWVVTSWFGFQACKVSMPSRAWVVTTAGIWWDHVSYVSMPSRAWVVTVRIICLSHTVAVSMPSRAWVVTARMSNILNFSWCFLCIPAIYRCILAYLPIFFNQLSKFLRCESPSTFLGTCLSHHSFIIFLVTNTNTLLSGLYLISTKKTLHFQSHLSLCVNALSGLYLISTISFSTFFAGDRHWIS